jgi:hypothetical protein
MQNCKNKRQKTGEISGFLAFPPLKRLFHLSTVLIQVYF